MIMSFLPHIQFSFSLQPVSREQCGLVQFDESSSINDYAILSFISRIDLDVHVKKLSYNL